MSDYARDRLARVVTAARMAPGCKVARTSDCDRRVVVALLKAIRLPTETMLNIGAVCSSTVPIPNTALHIWRAMIDQLITETLPNRIDDAAGEGSQR